MEELYNGIILPDPWPPRATTYASTPVPPAYLETPPAVIRIDVGRQLLVDDFLVADTTLHRTFHRPVNHPDNPVLLPDRPWELMSTSKGGISPHAMPFSDGIWYDPQDQCYKMWYYGGMGPSPSGAYGVTGYATSADGVVWEKPELDVVPWLDVPRNNIVHLGQRDSSTVWLDHGTQDLSARFKMSLYARGYTQLLLSADGLRWRQAGAGARTGDRTTFFYNPFRRKWVCSIRGPGALSGGKGRVRSYWEHDDFLAFDDRIYARKAEARQTNNEFFEQLRDRVEQCGAWPEATQVVLWTGADDADPRWPEFPDIAPQLYNLDAVAYESVMLGLFSVWRGDYRSDAKTPAAEARREAGRPKSNEVFVGFSRDGFHWDRPDRRPFLPAADEPGAWNWGNLQSAGGGCLIVGDQLYFYYSGRAGKRFPGSTSHDAGGSTGLAVLRRDGFASLDAPDGGGQMTTRPVRFSGSRLFVNLAAPAGELRVEALDEQGRAVAPYTAAACRPLSGDGTCLPVVWQDAPDLTPLAGRPVRFRFHLSQGELYAFWVSPDDSGRSNGFVAAGGPGFSGERDD